MPSLNLSLLLATLPRLAPRLRPHGGWLLPARNDREALAGAAPLGGYLGEASGAPPTLGSLLGPSGLSGARGRGSVSEVAESRAPGSYDLSSQAGGQEARGCALPRAWAPANRQQQRLLGRFHFKQKRTLSGNMCLFFSPSPSLPLLLSPFRSRIFLFWGPPFLCFSLSCSISLCLPASVSVSVYLCLSIS